MRVNALADGEVGNYLNRHFVAGFQKVATFRLNHGLKQGGNVASYFCAPDGRVLHAIAGPTDGQTFLREARWVHETYQLAQLERATPAQLQALFRTAHLERLQRERNLQLNEGRLPRPEAVTAKVLDDLLLQNAHLGLDNQGKVHLLLAVGAAPRLDQVYRPVFERILGERISTNPVVEGRR
ncbi:MAG: hypothetical protein L0Z62_32785 [Gemmataceae bacterium]|nr:hypothetical protein [Gemmataceae bacterium]